MVFQDLGNLTKGLVVLGIVLAVCFLIFSNLRSNATISADGNATKAITTSVAAADDIPGWLGLIVIVVVGALILRLLKVF